MAQASVTLTAARKYSAQLRRLLTTEQTRILTLAGNKVGAAFDGVVRDQLPPPVRRKKVAKYWTVKQRRWWWRTMHLKAKGKSQDLPGWNAEYHTVKVKGSKRTKVVLHISGSYKRTGTLPRSLAYWVEVDPSGVTVHYGSNRSYAKWVIDLKNQSKYHRGNWPVLQTLAYGQRANMNTLFAAVIEKELNNAGTGL